MDVICCADVVRGGDPGRCGARQPDLGVDRLSGYGRGGDNNAEDRHACLSLEAIPRPALL